MDLLPAPYGYGEGAHISLRAVGEIDARDVALTLLVFSAYPPSINKIVSCLQNSGRYDCVIMWPLAMNSWGVMSRMLAQVNVQLLPLASFVPNR